MIARADRVDRRKVPREDHYVHLYGVKWADYLRLLEIRGERAVPRLTYIEGTLEIMSPSRTHDEIKSYIGCLVEAWCLERGIEFTPYGSWTLKNKKDERGAEADECYVFGPEPRRKRRPDLALAGIDLEQLVSFLDRPTASQAIRDYRAALRGG